MSKQRCEVKFVFVLTHVVVCGILIMSIHYKFMTPEIGDILKIMLCGSWGGKVGHAWITRANKNDQG
jgi:hypothetical protein